MQPLNGLGLDWNHLRAFWATVEEGSLSAAAQRLQLSQPTLGRQVKALEEQLGVALFERTGRGLGATPAGLQLVHEARTMQQAAERLAMLASGHALQLDGPISITASEAISAVLLPPIIHALRQRYPGISVELVASNRPRDLRRREADIAIRNFRPQEEHLFAKKIRDAEGYLYASQRYLAQFPRLETAEDLLQAEFLGFDRSDDLRLALQQMGVPLQPHHFPIVSENHLVQWEFVKQGMGIGVMQTDIGDAEPAVVRVPVALPLMPVPMWLVAHRELQSNRRIRTVFDFLAAEL